jgi:hypothetical protein
MTLPETADAVAALLDAADLTNGEVLEVVAFVLLNLMQCAIQDGAPPLEALDDDLTYIRNWVTGYFAQPRMPAHTH